MSIASSISSGGQGFVAPKDGNAGKQTWSSFASSFNANQGLRLQKQQQELQAQEFLAREKRQEEEFPLRMRALELGVQKGERDLAEEDDYINFGVGDPGSYKGNSGIPDDYKPYMRGSKEYNDIQEDVIPEEAPAYKTPTKPAATQTERDDVIRRIQSAASDIGINPDYASAIAEQESDFNPTLSQKGSTAYGLFQLNRADRKKYGLGDNPTVDEQISAGVKKVKENYVVTEKALGREPSLDELYVTYYQGTGAGPKILSNPDSSFKDTLNEFGEGYYDRVSKANPWLSDIETNRDFMDWTKRRMAKRDVSRGIS